MYFGNNCWFAPIQRSPLVLILFLGLAFVGLDCASPQEPPPLTAQNPPQPASTSSTSRPDSASKRPKIVAFGDSLTAGFGLEPPDTYPARLQTLLDEGGYQYEVVNAGVSGETSAGGVRQIDRFLDDDVKVVVVCLGGNDGLRGLPVADLEKNLIAIVSAAKSKQKTVLLAGMEAPPQWGPEYTTAFRNVFKHVASEQNVPFVPFLLEGVATDPKYNQDDGIHPNSEGARIVARTVYSNLEPLLQTSALATDPSGPRSPKKPK